MSHPNEASNNENAAAKKQKVIVPSFGQPGTPPLVASGETKTMVFKIKNFEGLSDVWFTTDPIQCHGYDWEIILHPRANCRRGVLFVGLATPGCTVKADLTCRLDPEKEFSFSEHDFAGRDETNVTGAVKFHRSSIIDHCLDSEGTLAVEVDVDIYVPKREVFYPAMQVKVRFWSDLYNEEEEANVTFDVNGKHFTAHKNVLKIQAPGLYEIVQDGVDSDEPIVLTDVDETSFDMIHRFIYTMLDVEDALRLTETMKQNKQR